MNYSKYLLAAVFAFMILSSASHVKAQYIPEEEIIVAGQSVTITVPHSETLSIVYRPGSNISDTVRVPLEDAKYRWTPREAGIVALITPEGPVQTVSVRFEEFPLSGYIILFGAGFILFGGAIYASIKLFGKETPDEIASRPDT